VRLTIFFACLMTLFLPFATQAEGFETLAKQAVVIDVNTGQILFEKDPDTRMPTASMSKVMTAYVASQALADGQIKKETLMPVSERAWRMQGSKMFVELGNSIPVWDLLHGVVIQSGNDACVVLAEGIAGSEEAFAQRMNQTAAKLGMTNSNFMNATGWPDPNHYSTPRDLATLALSYMTKFPEEYSLNKIIDYTYHGIKQGNRNPLLYVDGLGADGVKTGHTEEAGYGLIGSAEQNGRRVIMVLSGMNSMDERAKESERVMRWAFTEFTGPMLFKKGEVVANADVWQGNAAQVPLTVTEDVAYLMQRSVAAKLSVKARFKSPIAAPIVAGQELGELEISAPGAPIKMVPLVAANDVDGLNPIDRLVFTVKYLLNGRAE
jgi:D-alanyl-D-alanine carboxypeptidase (penicillin-binding protein 5/6)